MGKRPVKKIESIYRILDAYFGDLNWWPARTRFEVVVGAILTQNTSWKNVEKAIKELRPRKLLTPEGILKAEVKTIESAIRCTGYYRQKTERLKEISLFFKGSSGGSIRKFDKENTPDIRERLLAVRGIGPETADSILLYALERPVFVVDAYTRRIFSRHGIITENAGYGQIQDTVHGALGMDTRAFNQFHALIVETAKTYCKKKAGLCSRCPLRKVGIKKQGKSERRAK
jgi:endonuclease III related protein